MHGKRIRTTAVLALVVLVACVAGRKKKLGEDCVDPGDCESGYCYEGFCRAPITQDPGSEPGDRDVPVQDLGPVDPGTPDVGTPDLGTPDVGPQDPGPGDPGPGDPGPGDPGTPDPGPVLPAGLECVGTVTWPQPAATEYGFWLKLVGVFTRAGIPGVTVRFCATADTACAQPLLTGTTDASGFLDVTVPSAPQGLGGYFEFQGGGLPDIIGFFPHPDPEAFYSATEGVEAFVLTAEEVVQMRNAAAAFQSADRGSFIFTARDCDFAPVAGVTVTTGNADGQTRALYMDNGVPVSTGLATDATGLGGLVDVPPGSTTLVATLAGPQVRLGTIDVLSRAGWLTSVSLVPSP